MCAHVSCWVSNTRSQVFHNVRQRKGQCQIAQASSIYARRSYSCWCKTCSRVRGRGHGSNSCGANLMVQGCTCTKQTFWTKDQFTVTASSGIRDRDTRVAEIVARELEKAKPDKWRCVQVRELWSPKEERQVRPGHFWLRKQQLRREEIQVGHPQVRGVQGGALWER